jgi:hypothetical protein
MSSADSLMRTSAKRSSASRAWRSAFMAINGLLTRQVSHDPLTAYSSRVTRPPGSGAVGHQGQALPAEVVRPRPEPGRDAHRPARRTKARLQRWFGPCGSAMGARSRSFEHPPIGRGLSGMPPGSADSRDGASHWAGRCSMRDLVFPCLGKSLARVRPAEREDQACHHTKTISRSAIWGWL